MYNHSVKNNGFTLIELLVASSLFVLVVGFGMSLWGSITRIQQANLNSQKVFSDSRFWFERISAEIQGGQIFYDDTPSSVFYPYPKPTNPQTELHISTQDGTRVRYYLDAPSGGLYKEAVGSGNPPERLSSAEIQVTRFAVYIAPTVYTALQAPHITILWQARDLKASNPQTINLQTTVSLRNY